ncbi:NAD(P)-dependent dehydrogenase, short-chain alcohol dehydrogenase family [Pelagirhabdus alkalitolerans]|uniref:NAD(P)-dependent dehydrogenase, short-chain alcohol dehydrogenase family n=1 Tax=Pelagirhabdus alkalitolerans TaxID=1612202 RepID=A0A1G6H7W8_9BACI|nr:SDR family oxidoreductase [Pelagirhabdus alkalitolerans]SDB89546.1 NAD(P)-dependent dehydrogenase, short-chain alcohol dehydrogenase family [Pelagirhabdus alkalitolerans]
MNVFITGANRGLGRALVQYALNNHHHVFATYRNDPGDLKNDTDERLSLFQVDVTNDHDLENVVDELKRSDTEIDVLINNAGLLIGREASIDFVSKEDLMKSFEVNAVGPALCVKHLLPLLKSGEMKKIINISSDSARLMNPYAGDYPYGMAKVALNMLTKKLNAELNKDQLQCISVHPGWMHTDMGGEHAPEDPNTIAQSIFEKIILRNERLPSDVVDFNGEAMNL